MKKKIKYDIEWLRSAGYADIKEVLNNSKKNPKAVRELNKTFATKEGQELAEQMISDPDYVPVTKRVAKDWSSEIKTLQSEVKLLKKIVRNIVRTLKVEDFEKVMLKKSSYEI